MVKRDKEKNDSQMSDYKILAKSHEDISDVMIGMADAFKKLVYAVVNYEDARKLLKAFGSIENIEFDFLELSSEEFNKYNKEYLVCLTDDMEVSVEPAWHDDNEYHPAGYLYIEDAFVFIADYANSAILKSIRGSSCFEFSIGEVEYDDDEFECDGDCENCEIYEADDGEISKEVVDAFEKIAKIILDFFYD